MFDEKGCLPDKGSIMSQCQNLLENYMSKRSIYTQLLTLKQLKKLNKYTRLYVLRENNFSHDESIL